MSPEIVASIVVSALTGMCGVWAARSARRTPRQEKRDDFTVVTERLDKDIERLQKRITDQESESEKQRTRISEQDEAIGWLLGRLRGLTSYIRGAGMSPPPADPMPDRVRKYVYNIDG